MLMKRVENVTSRVRMPPSKGSSSHVLRYVIPFSSSSAIKSWHVVENLECETIFTLVLPPPDVAFTAWWPVPAVVTPSRPEVSASTCAAQHAVVQVSRHHMNMMVSESEINTSLCRKSVRVWSHHATARHGTPLHAILQVKSEPVLTDASSVFTSTSSMFDVGCFRLWFDLPFGGASTQRDAWAMPREDTPTHTPVCVTGNGVVTETAGRDA
jgi:hypothetical protein